MDMPKCPYCHKKIDKFNKLFVDDYVIYSCPHCSTFLTVVDPDPFEEFDPDLLEEIE